MAIDNQYLLTMFELNSALFIGGGGGGFLERAGGAGGGPFLPFVALGTALWLVDLDVTLP